MKKKIWCCFFSNRDGGWDFLPLRCWIGLWTTLLILLIVAFDLSALVRYITRFTEESFACLIAIIFIYEAFKKQIHIVDHYGINPHPEIPISHDCHCMPPNNTMESNMTGMNMTTLMTSFVAMTTEGHHGHDHEMDIMGNMSYETYMNGTNITWSSLSKDECLEFNGTLHGDGCDAPHYYPDVFFLSCLLFLGTYTIAMGLKDFKTSAYFPTFVSIFC